jgi:rod shape-determining protein MreC
VYDKTVRRRRAVLGLLLASSLILLTLYFGESAGGGLHSVQRGVLQVVSPIQEGASRALKPFRDLFGWVGDTLDAKGQVKSLRAERDQLRAQAIAGVAATRENQQLKRLMKLEDSAGLTAANPVRARVIGQDPSLWFTQIEINKGTGDGLREGQPVVTGEGLIGRVSSAASGTAIVTLISDHTTNVGARVNESSGITGVVQVEAGRPDDLVLSYTKRSDVVTPGQTIVTSGTMSRSDRLASPFPPDIPIGRVTRVDEPGTDNQLPHVQPFANLRRLEFVDVLTKQVNGNRPKGATP